MQTKREIAVNTNNPSLKLALVSAQSALDKLAENLKILNVSEVSGFTDFFVICSAHSQRQVQAIADAIQDAGAEEGLKPYSIEGVAEGRWVLIDFGSVVVHIFLDAIREYYDLERLWAEAPKVQIPPELYGPAATKN